MERQAEASHGHCGRVLHSGPAQLDGPHPRQVLNLALPWIPNPMLQSTLVDAVRVTLAEVTPNLATGWLPTVAWFLVASASSGCPTASLCCRYLEQLPPTLFVTELLARSAVQMSKHYIVQCQLGFLTDRQLTKLQVSEQPSVLPLRRSRAF